MAEVATAFVTLLPSAKGFGTKLDQQIGGQVDGAGKRSGSRFGSALAVGLKGGAAIGAVALGALVKSSVSLEAQFSKTMNVLQATTGASGTEMESLSALAIKMGADTVFSAGDASKAMLELARGGITPANIQAGALQGTLTLAAAGELEMGEAANIAVKAMGQFNLQGKDMNSIAAALSGAANASSASVRDMSAALAQGGLAANSVGFSIQETTGIFAAFSNAGLEGSDAGTSLKTTLDRLQPTTTAAEAALRGLGVITADGTNRFIKANGEYESAARIAEVLKQGTEKLTDAESKRLITQAFGSDAQRGATILAQEGAKGINAMVKATSDQGAAEKTAAANMKGTAGALEQLKGAWETLRLQVGLALAPVVQATLRGITKGINALGPAVQKVAGFMSGLSLGGSGGGFLSSIKEAGTALFGFIRSLLPTLQKIGSQIGAVLGPAFRDIGKLIQNDFVPAFKRILPIIQPVAKFLLGVFGSAVVGAIKGIVQALKGAITLISGIFNVISAIVTGDWSRLWLGLKQIVSGAVNLVIGVIRAWLNIGILQIFKKGVLGILGAWRGLWSGLRGLAAKAGTALRGVAARVFAGIRAVIVGAIRGYIGFWRGLFTGLRAIAVNGFKVLRSAFGGALAAIRTVVSQAMGRVRATFTAAWNAIKSGVSAAFRAVRTAASNGVSTLVGVVRSIPGRAKSALGNLAGTFVNAGRELIAGLIRGIGEKLSALADKMRDVANTVKGFLPGSPVKTGPLTSWNRGGAGKRLVGLLADGLGDTREVDAAMARLSRRVQIAAPSIDGTITGRSIAGGGSAATSGRPVNIYEAASPMKTLLELARLESWESA